MPLTPQSLAGDLLACLRFYTRVPLPVLSFEQHAHNIPDFSRLAPVVPVAGALVGACGALALVAASLFALSPFVSAALAVGAMLRVTGAFHEDGLADVADGFGGGPTRERRLEIMRDSRIGAFGASALVLALVLRIGLLAALIRRFGPAVACADLVASATISRVAGLLPLTVLAPARTDGAGRAAEPPTLGAFAAAVVGALVIALGLGLAAGGSSLRALGSGLAAGLAGLYMTFLARRLIGGQTGDVAGAAQQVAEITCLCVYLGHWPSG